MVNYAKRMDNVKASDIRQLLALTARPEVTSFAGGLPAPELFPVAEFQAACDAVLTENGRVALQYGTTEGWTPLREQIVERLYQKNGIQTSAKNILLTAGSQQGLDYCGRLFLDPGDVVVLESPSYLGAINAFRLSEPNYVEVPTDENGMIMSELDRVLAATPNVKMIYVIPDFQNPTGRTWPLERRKEFIEIINKYEVVAIEDNPYGDLRYKGEYLPSLKSLDTKGLVIYLGTFSKILSPGTRIAWICANEDYIGKFNLIAQAAVLQTSTFSAMAVSKFLEMNDIDKHVEKIRAVYGHRAGVMVQAMKDFFPDCVQFTDPDGGLFTWAELPDYINTREMASQCLARNVAYVPGSGFFPKGDNNHCMRLNYSCSNDEQIVAGIKIIGDIIKENLK